MNSFDEKGIEDQRMMSYASAIKCIIYYFYFSMVLI
jgi:hypothetical protein